MYKWRVRLYLYWNIKWFYNFNDYFQIDTNINNNLNEICNDELFTIYQCPEGNDLSISEGKIEEFKSNDVILHKISTDKISSGGPLIYLKI